MYHTVDSFSIVLYYPNVVSYVLSEQKYVARPGWRETSYRARSKQGPSPETPKLQVDAVCHNGGTILYLRTADQAILFYFFKASGLLLRRGGPR